MSDINIIAIKEWLYLPYISHNYSKKITSTETNGSNVLGVQYD